MFLERVCLAIVIAYIFENIFVCTALNYACPEGYIFKFIDFVNNFARGYCVEVEAGYYARNNVKIPCSPSFYQDEVGKDFCKSCPVGRITNRLYASTECIFCGVGKEPNPDAGCRNCPIGKYQNSESNTPCLPCPLGYYQDEAGSGNCKICSRSNSGVAGSQGCCFPGSYLTYPGSGFLCVEAEAGYVALNDVRKSCTGSLYQDEVEQFECKQCPGDLISNNDVAATNCIVCGVGQEPNPNGGCNNCPFGKYKSSESNTPCLPCPLGYYQDEQGSRTCKICSLSNTYSDVEGSWFCSTCPDKTYQYVQNFRGGFDALYLKTSYTGCQACPYRYHVNPEYTGTMITKICEYCELNEITFCDDGQKRIKSTPILGQTYISQIGNWNYDNSIANCTLSCSANQYMSENCTKFGNAKCSWCRNFTPFETYVFQPCSTYEDAVMKQCNFSDGDFKEGGNCNPCMPGSVKEVNEDKCVKCPENTKWYEYSFKNTTCIPCEPNTYSVEGSTKCLPILSLGGLGSNTLHLKSATPRNSVFGASNEIKGVISLEGGKTFLALVNFPNGGTIYSVVDNRTYIAGGNSFDSQTLVKDGSGVNIKFGKLLCIEKYGKTNNIFQNNIFLTLETLEQSDQNWLIRELMYDSNSKIISSQILSFESKDSSYSLSSLNFGEPSDLLFLSEGTFLVSFKKLRIIFQASVVNPVLKRYELTPWKGSRGTLPDPLPANINSYFVESFYEPSKMAMYGQSILYVFDKKVIWSSNTNERNLKHVCGNAFNDMTCSAAVSQNGQCHSLNFACYTYLDMKLYGGNQILVLGRGISYSGSDFNVFSINVLAQTWNRLSTSSTKTDFYSSYDLTGSLLLGFVKSPMEENAFWIYESKYSIQEEKSLGVSVLRGSIGKHLCSAGTFFNENLQTCLQTPVGYYTPEWNMGLIPCPVGWTGLKAGGTDLSACVRCPVRLFDTSIPEGSINCVYAESSLCRDGKVWNSELESCVQSCEANKYYNGEECVFCPLGTTVRESITSLDPKYQCKLCEIGTYGSSPGICAPCPENTLSGLSGSLVCSPVYSPSHCSFDGLHKTEEEINACANNQTSFIDNQWWSVPEDVKTLSVTSGGTLFVGNGKHLWKMARNKGLPRWIMVGYLSSGGPPKDIQEAYLRDLANPTKGVKSILAYFFPHSAFVLDDSASSVQNPFSVMAVSDDERFVYFTENGASCIWKAEMYSEWIENTQSKNVPMMESPWKWVGDCNSENMASDFDGSRFVATFGKIRGMTLMETDSPFSDILFVSTEDSEGCMNVRSVMIADGSVGTLIGHDRLQSPLIFLSSCPVNEPPYVLATSRGSNILYYSTRNMIKKLVISRTEFGSIFLSEVDKMESNVYQHDNVFSNIESICTTKENNVFFQVWNPSDSSRNLWHLKNTMANSLTHLNNVKRKRLPTEQNIACLGRHLWFNEIQTINYHTRYPRDMEASIYLYNLFYYWETQWYSANRIEISMYHINNSNEIRCAGGFVRDQNSRCWQVGLGSFTGGSDNLGNSQVCPSGTRSIRSGMWTRRQCQVCQKGTSSTSSSFVCSRCLGNTCQVKCAKGYFQIVDSYSGKTICTPCPAGHSSAENSIGISSCEPCSREFYSNINTSFQCIRCPADYTSESRSSYCVKKCDLGKCSKDGETCENMQNNYQVITSLKLGEKMSSVYAGNNNEVFMSNGNSIFYMQDNCPEYADAKLSSLCKPVYRDLLPPMDPQCVNNYGRGILSMVMSPSYINEGLYDVYYLYVVSQSTYQVYRIPLYFLRNLLSVEKTKQVLHASENAIGQCGLEKWAFCGLKGASANFNGDGDCARVSFSRLSDIAILRNGSGLVVSDFDNQRIRYIDIEKKSVRTLIGNSARCWKEGAIPTPPSATCQTYGFGGVNNPNGLTLDDNDVLHISMQNMNGYGTIDMKNPVKFEYQCLMNNIDQYKEESKKSYCRKDTDINFKSCFLYSPNDIVKYSGSLLVSVVDGITQIDLNTGECTAVGGSFWKFGSNTRGYIDGDVNTSKFNLPFRLSVSESRKMLYIADRNNNALRRAYMDSSCKCPNGFVFLPETRSCYNPLLNKAQNTDEQCPFGSYYSYEYSKCKSCDEETFSIINDCILYLNIVREQNMNQGYETGYSYQKVWSNPFPMINVKISDWFGIPYRKETESWNAFFKGDSTVTYSLGSANGRVPYGNSFHTYTYRSGKCILQDGQVNNDGCWMLEKRSDYKPKMILPGMWYPCHTSRDILIPSWRSEEVLHTCPWNVGTFGDPDASSACAKASWECLRMAAIEGQGVSVGTSLVLPENLENYVYRNSPSFYEKHKIKAWSRFLIMGSSEADGEACGASASGPCFPVFKHVQEGIPESVSNLKLSGRNILDYQLKLSPVAWKNAKGVFSYVGWPSHYYCPNGYTWVAPNSSDIPNQNMFTKVGTDGIKAAVTCISCLPGTFSMVDLPTKKLKGGPYQCRACSGGTFSSGVGATECEVCPVNFYGDKKTGSSTCVSCAPGFYSLSGSWTNESCTPCAPGTEVCKSCAAGFYQPLSAQVKCYACSAGFYSSVRNSVKCNACSVGFYQNEAGKEGCKPCEEGTFSSRQASTTCTTCQNSTLVNCQLSVNGVCGRGCGVNYYWDTDNKKCMRCPMNGISNKSCGIGLISCINGETKGQYVQQERSIESGGDKLDFCDSGTEPNTDYRSCVLCSVGKYSVWRGVGCISCPIGFFAANNGSSACLACRAGQYSSAEGSSSCNNCSKGYANINNMSSNCTPCNPGSYAEQEGSAVCQLCKNSTFSTVVALEFPCDALGHGNERGTCKNSDGYYSGMGATACSYCGIGEVEEDECRGCGLGHYFNATEKKCRICPVGTVNDKNSSLTTVEGCQECPTVLEYAGENRIHCYRVQLGYMRNEAKNGEFPCPQGYYRGMKNLNCTKCSPGSYSDQMGKESCAKCPPGKHQPSEGASSSFCLQCENGKVASTEGMGSCTTCADGYKHNSNKTLCETCPRNQYVNQLWKSCELCPNKQVSPVGSFLSSHCKSCSTPYYFEPSTQDCALCVAGKYKKNEECEMCPAGKINANPGGALESECISCMVDKNKSHGYITNQERTECIPCPRGQESSTENNTCIMCRRGYYSDDSSPCKPCEAGTFNNALGSSVCFKCDLGKYAMDTGSTNCVQCEIGKYNNESGQTQCKTCTFELGFSSRVGQVQCTQRFQRCPGYGYYLRLNYEDPTKDNSCERCRYCQSDELLVVYESKQILNGSVSENQIFMEKYCPGNETKAGYECLRNEPLAGVRLSIENPSNMAGSSATSSSPGTGFVFSSSSYQYVSCDQINVEANTYGQDIWRKLVGYVAGSLSTMCYVGCRYGIKAGGIQSYLEEAGGKKNSESPELNIFHTRMISYSERVCNLCPVETCSTGFYRPRSKDVDQCGPSCYLNNDEYRSACLKTNMDGCVLRCQPAPNNSVISGGSNQLDFKECPFQCNIGFFKSSDGKGCISCERDVSCGPGFIHLSPSECLPHYTMNDMCKPCAAIEGGRGKFYNSSLGKCVYMCYNGYYADNYGSECKRCNETFEPCPKGEYMDVQSCFVNGLKPACKPCNVSLENQRSVIHFLTDGGSSPLQCRANCLMGYNTKYAGNGTYIDISTTQPFSHEIQCEVCNRDNGGISCNNRCFYGQYRDLSVINPGSVGACKNCKKDSQCGAGMRATKCTGNETSDSACVKCPPSLLLDNITKVQNKVFVPYNFQGIGASAQCPTACKPNYFQTNDGSCITCEEYVKSKNCASFSVANYEVGQPKPCDFKFSHWNASLGKRWWKAKYTPWFMALALAVEDQTNPDNNLYLRSGRCWACPSGTRTLETDPDLCTLNEGVELGIGRVEESTVLSPRANPIISATNTARPLLSVYSLSLVTLSPRRRLLQIVLNATNRSSGTDLIQVTSDVNNSRTVFQLCDFGFYKSNRLEVKCDACPQGTTTATDGSTSIRQCICLPGHVRSVVPNSTDYFELKNSSNSFYDYGCVPCGVDMYREFTSSEFACIKCPENETTFGLENSSSCVCKLGYRRDWKTKKCIQCGKGEVCVPCTKNMDGKETERCPFAETHVIGCFYGGSSIAGSWNIMNCTCRDDEVQITRNPRFEMDISIRSQRLAQENYYCLKKPQRAVYDAVRKQILCPWGWRYVINNDTNPPVLVDCILCGLGRYSESLPNETSNIPANCKKCPKGSYSDIGWMVGNCTKCDSGFSTVEEGSSSKSNCDCPYPLRLSANGSQCEGCDSKMNYFDAVSKRCVQCPPETMVASSTLNPSSITDCVCKAGYTMKTPNEKYEMNKDGCVPCSKGTYRGGGNLKCLPCPRGSSTSKIGATNVLECDVCLDGYSKGNFWCIKDGLV